MAIQNGFFKSINGDRRYLAEFFTSYFASFIGNGVFPNPSTNLQVINNQNFSTIVRPGKGWINGHYLNNDDNIVINHQPPDGVLRRIDRIVFSVNLDSRSMDIYLKQGTPSTNAVAPTLIRNSTLYELALADIAFNPGATSISQSNITDQRMNRSLCGIVHGVVEQLDTTTLFNQYQQFLIDKGVEFDQQLAVNQQTFDDWFAQLNDILDGDVAANLANMIITHTNNATPQKHIEVVNAIPQNLANKGLLLLVDDVDNPNNPPEVPTSIVLDNKIEEVNQQLMQATLELQNKAPLSETERLQQEKAELNYVNNGLNQLESKKAEVTDLQIERARIDSFVSLPPGSTAGNSELIDGRIGANGVTYDNIGTAIRKQLMEKEQEISDINNLYKRSTNLFNANSFVEGYTISNSAATLGQLIPNPLYNTSEMNKIVASTTYIYRGFHRLAYYDSEFNVVSVVNMDYNPQVETSPSNAAFYRVHWRPDFRYDRQINLGSTLLPYEQYYIKLNDVTPDFNSIDITVMNEATGLNLYPFHRRANLNVENYLEIFNSIKSIRLYGADPNKKYRIDRIDRARYSSGADSYTWRVTIRDSDNLAVCGFTVIDNYTEPNGYATLNLRELSSSGISGTLKIDWSQLKTSSYDSLQYDNTGLDESTYVIENSEQTGSNIRGLRDYYLENIEDSNPRINNKIEVDTLSFVVMTDIHTTINNIPVNTSVEASSVLAEYADVDFVALLGDYIIGDLSKKDSLKLINDVVDLAKSHIKCPMYAIKGNHDSNDYPNLNGLTNEQKIARLITNKEFYQSVTRKSGKDIVIDSDNPYGGYFYVNHDKQKIRAIYLNTSEMNEINGIPNVAGTFVNVGVRSQKQLNWFANTALKVDSDWAVILFSHIPPISETYMHNRGNVRRTVIETIKAFMEGRQGTYVDPTLGDTVSFDFESQGPREFIGHILGHVHEDSYAELEGINYFINNSVVPAKRFATSLDRELAGPTTLSTNTFVVNRSTRTVNVIKTGTGIDYQFNW